MDAILRADRALFLCLNHARNPVFDWLMPALSDLKLFLPVLVPVLAWRLWRGGRRERVMWLGLVAAVVAADLACARLIKPLVGRMRPYVDLDGVWVASGWKWFVTNPTIRAYAGPSLSWPSCHAANIWTAGAYLARWRPRWWPGLLPLALAVSYSRIYLGEHYPLDVLGGALLGAAWGWGLACLLRRRVEGGRTTRRTP
nr:phosphatase PAP2 family protein [Dissulfurirhabdus thermomarina]